ncbi:DUF4258 domain-containing protein [Bacillus cereus]|uniref:DUF4258 domain-containing protein n=1 Tax=Bacillus cereus TaxID=1396 RepID=UPI00187995A4|nr:DUF4258 domain-containing protein [Bacillus cereus]MBE7123429.1 DUF4258 domain-containing protein [Bacillus cereus]
MSNCYLSYEIYRIRKSLKEQRVLIGGHTELRCMKRGYFRKDIISCLNSGEITRVQNDSDDTKYIIEGEDSDGNPVVAVVAIRNMVEFDFKLVTFMPPVDNKRFSRVIGIKDTISYRVAI